MPSQSQSEVIGDWNNLKGTHYHLLYALWLIICNRAASVECYRGNDLLAFPLPIIVPPLPADDLDEIPPISLHSTIDKGDLWIQLKSTSSKWTLSDLLEENLLINFIHNGLTSERNGRDWKAMLISQGQIDAGKLRDFIDSPAKYKNLNKSLDKIIDRVCQDLSKSETPSESRSQISKIAFEVLRNFLEYEPVPFKVLKAEIHAQLILNLFDEKVAGQVENQLIGAMLEDSAGGPSASHSYNAEWVNRITQIQVVRDDLLDKGVGLACNLAAQRYTSQVKFAPEYFARRVLLETAFDRFLYSKQTCFVLVGLSGTGKTWISSDIALTILRDRPRILVSGNELGSARKLENIVASELKRYSTANWTDELFLKKFRGAEYAGEQFRPILIIDNLVITDDVETYRHNLARIITECRDAGIKLVLTCQSDIWNFLQPGKYIDPEKIFLVSETKNEAADSLDTGDLDIDDSDGDNADQAPEENDYDSFLPSQFSPSNEIPASFVLSDFSPEEMENAIRTKIPEKHVEVIINQMRAPAFIALRRPYFFSRYFEKNLNRLKKGAEVPVSDIDELLDWSVSKVVEKAALELKLSRDDIFPALELFVKTSWPTRSRGIEYVDALKCLRNKIGDQANQLIIVWRKTGFLSTEGLIQFAEPLVADHLFGRYLKVRLKKLDFAALSEINPASDFGIIVALLRNIPRPVDVAVRLLERDEKWLEAIASGFAQVPDPGWPILAMLHALLNEHEYSRSNKEICEALGQLASRTEKGLKWVGEMYMGDRARTWRRGSQALISTFEYAPQRVEALARARLQRLLQIRRDFFDRDKRENWILSHALDPFRYVTHKTASDIAQKISNRYKSIIGSDDVNNRHRKWFLVTNLDEIRGRVAIFNEDVLAELLLDLTNNNPVSRYRASQAIKEVLILKPEIAQEVLCSRIRMESDHEVLKNLLISAYHLIDKFASNLISALTASKAVPRNGRSGPTNGLVLELLGNLADLKPGEVFALLSENLVPLDIDDRVLLSEIFIYAWWRCLEVTQNTDREPLYAILEGVDQSAITPEFRCFAMRGSAIAILAQMCLDLNISTVELKGRQIIYPNTHKELFYLELTAFFEKHLSALSKHLLFPEFQQHLIDCVSQGDPTNIHPFFTFRDAVFTCANLSLELLTAIAAKAPDPLPILNALPKGWQAIKMVTGLLKMGIRYTPVVEFAKQILVTQEKQTTIQADSESQELLAQLALLDSNPKQSLRQQRDAARKFSLFSDSSNAHGITVLTAESPDRFLEFLNETILTVDDVVTLYNLVDKARNWQAVLIARVYARMLNERPINKSEAEALCEQMLLAIRSFSDSAIRDQYEQIYRSIHDLLKTETRQIVPFADHKVDSDKNVIRGSHQLAFNLIDKIISTQKDQRTHEWLNDLIYSFRWWEESDRFEFKDSLLISGVGIYQVYFFPAVRLLLVAAGLKAGVPDPAGRIMRERRETHKLLSDRDYLLRQSDLQNYDAEALQDALEDFQTASERTPKDERIDQIRGGILVRLKRLSEAEKALKRSLALQTASDRTKAGTLYDLACVYALQKRPRKCQAALIESNKLRPVDKEWVGQDPDLREYRDKIWFRKFWSK